MDTEPAGTPSAVPMERLLYEVKKVIVGQDHLLERMIVALLARGHLLVEGVPGLAKTMAIKTLAQAIGGDFKRIQFTPDLVPADLVGTRIYNQKTGEFTTSLGPGVHEPAARRRDQPRPGQGPERAAGGDAGAPGHDRPRDASGCPDPFLVLATQNPIETEGTYALPEAQVDRFMLKVLVGYPTPTEEFAIVERMTDALSSGPARSCRPSDLAGAPAGGRRGVRRPGAVRLRGPARRRDPRRRGTLGMPELARYITFGASPRASINLILTGRALAFVRGRQYVLPEDVLDMAPDVMRHRLVLSYEALSDDITADRILSTILERVPPPDGAPARAVADARAVSA